MKVRIQILLSGAGIASRRKAEELICAGRVSVNGLAAKLGDRADPSIDIIKVDGKRISLQAKIYIMLNKPAGYVCTKRGEPGKPSIYSLLDAPSIQGKVLAELQRRSLFTVGRLDADAEGLLLLTNDGSWANKLAHPSAEVMRSYKVIIDGKPSESDAQKMLSGIRTKSYVAKADALAVLSEGKSSTLHITLHSGRKHEVKELVKGVGHSVLYIQRISFGSYKLAGLPVGRWAILKGN